MTEIPALELVACREVGEEPPGGLPETPCVGLGGHWVNGGTNVAMTEDERRKRAHESRQRYLARNADRLKAERKAKYAADPEGAKAAATAWRLANKGAHRAAVKRYRAANPDLKRAEKSKRRAVVRGVGGRFTKADVQALHEQQGGRCVYCRIELREYEVDHVMPLALGGSNDRSNLQLLCPPCNRAKGAMHPEEFAQRMAAA